MFAKRKGLLIRAFFQLFFFFFLLFKLLWEDLRASVGAVSEGSGAKTGEHHSLHWAMLLSRAGVEQQLLMLASACPSVCSRSLSQTIVLLGPAILICVPNYTAPKLSDFGKYI